MASYVGIDIGINSCKFALREGSKIRCVRSRMPENMVDADHRIVTPDTLGEFLGKMRRKEHIHNRNCVLVLSEAQSFFRHTTLPAMSSEEVKLNLPYEFRDFVLGDPDEYNYDYIVDQIVRNDKGAVERLELYAAAASRKTIDVVESVLHRAGFKLKTIVPSQLAYSRLIEAFNAANPNADHERDIILVDIAHNDIVVLLYHGAKFKASRVVELGCHDIDMSIADLKGIDSYTADSYKYTNFEGVLDDPVCQAIYDHIAVEINKVINFYNFNNPDKNIEQMYFLGGGAQIPQLIETIEKSVNIPTDSIMALLPPQIGPAEAAPACALALAGMLEGEAL